MKGDGVSWEEEGFGLPDRLTPSPSPSGERGDVRGEMVSGEGAGFGLPDRLTPSPSPSGERGERTKGTEVRTSEDFSVRGMSGRMRGNARVLRRYQTPAEERLWAELRGRKIEGLKFRRQCSIGKFIVDFLCYECALIIEVDGAQHADVNVREYDDDVRTRYLNEQGFEVLRFTNMQVESEIELVTERIARVAHTRRAVLPSPQRERGRG